MCLRRLGGGGGGNAAEAGRLGDAEGAVEVALAGGEFAGLGEVALCGLEVALPDLVALGRRYNLLVVEDLGSGCLVDLSRYGIEREPTVQETLNKANTDFGGPSVPMCLQIWLPRRWIGRRYLPGGSANILERQVCMS